jgi:transcriptional regulator with XRE-family HTH domain
MRGFTQQKLAQQADLSLVVVTNVEQGITKDPAMSSLIKLADALRVSLDEMVGREYPPRNGK